MFPKDIRGMLNSLFSISAQIGVFIYLIFCEKLFEMSPRAPMLGISMVDLLMAIILLIIMSFTKLGTLQIENDSLVEA